MKYSLIFILVLMITPLCLAQNETEDNQSQQDILVLDIDQNCCDASFQNQNQDADLELDGSSERNAAPGDWDISSPIQPNTQDQIQQ